MNARPAPDDDGLLTGDLIPPAAGLDALDAFDALDDSALVAVIYRLLHAAAGLGDPVAHVDPS